MAIQRWQQKWLHLSVHQGQLAGTCNQTRIKIIVNLSNILEWSPQSSRFTRITGHGGKEDNCHRFSLWFHSSGILSDTFPPTVKFLAYNLFLFIYEASAFMGRLSSSTHIGHLEGPELAFFSPRYSLRRSNQITTFSLNIIWTSTSFLSAKLQQLSMIWKSRSFSLYFFLLPPHIVFYTSGTSRKAITLVWAIRITANPLTVQTCCSKKYCQ